MGTMGETMIIIEYFLPQQKIDDNGDGAISFDEWLAFVINKYKGEHDL